MARRKYTLVKHCSHEGCKDTAYYEYSRRADYNEAWRSYSKHGYKCHEHSSPNVSLESMLESIKEAETLIGKCFVRWKDVKDERSYAGVRIVTKISTFGADYSSERGWKTGTIQVYSRYKREENDKESWQDAKYFVHGNKSKQDAIDEINRMADEQQNAYEKSKSDYHWNDLAERRAKEWQRFAREIEAEENILIIGG